MIILIIKRRLERERERERKRECFLYYSEQTCKCVRYPLRSFFSTSVLCLEYCFYKTPKEWRALFRMFSNFPSLDLIISLSLSLFL